MINKIKPYWLVTFAIHGKGHFQQAHKLKEKWKIGDYICRQLKPSVKISKPKLSPNQQSMFLSGTKNIYNKSPSFRSFCLYRRLIHSTIGKSPVTMETIVSITWFVFAVYVPHACQIKVHFEGFSERIKPRTSVISMAIGRVPRRRMVWCSGGIARYQGIPG